MINISKLAVFLVPLFLVLAQYKLSIINLGFLLFQSITVLILFSNFFLRVQRDFLIFFLSIFASLSFSILVHGTLFHGTVFYYLNGLTLFFVVIVFANYINPYNLYRWYSIVGCTITVVVLLQGGYMLVTGEHIAPIKLLPVAAENERLWMPESRPSGFFTEPQLYASFILPLFLLSILKRNFKVSFLILLGVIISGSTYGLFVIGVLFLWLLIATGRLTSIRAWFGLFFCILLLVIAFLTTGLFDNTVEKLLRTDITQGIRVAKAPVLFWEMSTYEKLFGMKGTVEDFIKQNLSSFPWLSPYVESGSHLLGYITGLFGLAIYFGIFPMFLFLLLLLKTYLYGDSFQKGVAIIILLHSISATILFNGYFVFFFILLFANSFDGSSKLKYWNFK